MLESRAKSRFEQTKKAVGRLHDVQLMIMNECDDWRPPSVSSKNALHDPTSGAAIRKVDEIDGRMAALRAEESELIEFIGEALVIIRAVRNGFGEKYADILEWRYIDCMTWERISDDYEIKKRTGCRYLNIAFDWVDSIGITRIMAGDLEI